MHTVIYLIHTSLKIRMSHRTFKVVDPYDAASPDEGMSVKPGEILEEMSNSDAADGDEFVLCKKQDG